MVNSILQLEDVDLKCVSIYHSDILEVPQDAMGTKTNDRQRIWGLNIVSDPMIAVEFKEAIFSGANP